MSISGKRTSARLLLCACLLAPAGCSSSGPWEPEIPPLLGAQRSVVQGAGSRSVGPLGHVRHASARAMPSFEQLGTGRFVNANGPVSVGSGVTAHGAGVTLNLVNATVAEAAKAVLGDTLGLTYSVHDKLAVRLTLQTTKPVPKDALIEIFEAALGTVGVGISVVGGVHQVLPSSSLHEGALRLAQAGTGRIGQRISILPLTHVAAGEMARMLDGVAPKSRVVKVDASRNLLMVSGTHAETREIDRFVGLFDVDWLKGMSFALYPVKSSDPDAVGAEIEKLLGTDSESPLRGTVRIIPNRRLGAILVTSSRPQHLATVKAWIDRLDNLAEHNEEQLHIYKIQNRPAGELADLLQEVLATEQQRGQAGQEGVVAPRYAPTRVAATGSASVAVPAAPKTATVLQTRAAGGVGAGRRVVADDANNTLLVHATAKDYARILRILERLDVLPTQVMIEAVIAEITLNNELRFGVKWFFQKANNRFTLTDAVNGAVASTFPGFSYFFETTNIQVALDALSGITRVNVVSAPSLMVMDNRKATLQIGDQVPVATQSAQSIVNPGAPLVNTISFKDTGVILSVTPRVNDSGRVILDIEQEVSNVARTTSSGIDSPTIQQRKVKTTVVVVDGEVVALGGLIQSRKTDQRTQVPLFGDIPILGSAFKQKEDVREQTELVIFIRPVVARDANEARQVTTEFERRMARQFRGLPPHEVRMRKDLKRMIE